MKLVVALVLALSITYGFAVPAVENGRVKSTAEAVEVENDKHAEDDDDDGDDDELLEGEEDDIPVSDGPSEDAVEPADDAKEALEETGDGPLNNPSSRRRRRRRRRNRRRRRGYSSNFNYWI